MAAAAVALAVAVAYYDVGVVSLQKALAYQIKAVGSCSHRLALLSTLWRPIYYNTPFTSPSPPRCLSS